MVWYTGLVALKSLFAGQKWDANVEGRLADTGKGRRSE